MILTVVAGLWGAAAFAQVGLEYEVKAAFLYNFTRYVDWPSGAFDQDGPFRLCVAGRNPFGGALAAAVQKESVAGHPIEVVPAPDDPSRCHLLFIPASEAARAPELIAAVRSSSVLVVGEQRRFLDQGGTVNFVIDSGHVRFEINTRARTAAGLNVSSRLLRLARTGSDSGALR